MAGAGAGTAVRSLEGLLLPKPTEAKHLLEALGADQQLAALILWKGDLYDINCILFFTVKFLFSIDITFKTVLVMYTANLDLFGLISKKIIFFIMK